MAQSRSRAGTLNSKLEKTIHDIETAFLMGAHNDPDAFLLKLKPLFKDCIELRAVPIHYRGEVRLMQLANLMSIGEIEGGSVLISEGNVTPDLYVVLRGMLEAKSSRSRQGVAVKCLETCGDAKPLTGLEWVPCTIKALERTKFLTIPHTQLADFIEKIDHIKENTEIKEFVVATVPGAKYLGLSGKEKLISYFSKVTFKKGDFLVKQGQCTSHAYIIRSGECLKTLQICPSPSKPSLSRLSTPVNPPVHLSILTPKQWVGEECLIDCKPAEYTAVAMTSVLTLCIDFETFNEKLPKETIQMLKLCAESKKKWKNWRMEKVKDTRRLKEGEEKGERLNGLRKLTSVTGLKPRPTEKPDLSGSSVSPIRLPARDSSWFLTEPGETDTPLPLKALKIPAKNDDFAKGKTRICAKILGRKMSATQRTKSARLVRRLSPTKLILRSIPEHFGYRDATPPPVADTYIEHLLRPRPLSPNPSEIWARRHHLDLDSFKTPSPVK